MDPIKIAAICLAIHPDAEITHGREYLQREPEIALALAAKHAIATDAPRKTEAYQALREALQSTHLQRLNEARAARALAEERAGMEKIRASIRQKKTNLRLGRPGEHGLTPAESALEALDSQG